MEAASRTLDPPAGSTPVPDAVLVARSLEDPEAFGCVFERHFTAVHRYLHRRVGRDVADDLAGDVFRLAFERRAQWSQRSADARPWLLGIATNLLRRRRRDEQRRLRALARGAADVWADPSDSEVALRVDAQARRGALAAALADLAARDRDVVALIALADLSTAEVADALGIPPGTVASRLHRARRRLRAALRDELNELGDAS